MRSKYGPHVHRINRVYDAVGRITLDDERMRGDNTKAWLQRVPRLLAFLGGSAKSLGDIKAWCRTERHPTTMMEECLYWLEARGRVARGDDRKWRLV